MRRIPWCRAARTAPARPSWMRAALPEDRPGALRAYEAERLPATTKVVLTNRTNPPDAILREVFLRTGDKPFARIEDVISREEMLAITGAYKRVACYDLDTLKTRAAE